MARTSFSKPIKKRDQKARALYHEMLRSSLVLFAQDILGMQIGPHLLAWEQIIQRHNRVCILAARDHGKSAFMGYAYPIWRAWREPGCQVYMFSKTLDQAIDHLDAIVNGHDNLRGLLNTPELEHLIPVTKTTGEPQVNKKDLKLTNGSRIRAVGYGKAVRGRHPKYIVLDDPLNDEDMWSETQRMKHIEYFKSAISQLVTPGGQIVVVGTPFHVSDLYGWLRENKKYRYKEFPAILKDTNGNDRALFPWRYALDDLYSKKEEIGTVAFAREMLVQPITDELAIFPSTLFPPLHDSNLTLKPTLASIQHRGLQVFFGIDIARSASVGADYFVIFVLGRDGQGNRHVIDIHRSKGLPFNRQLEMIQMMAAKYQPSLVCIEANQMQQVWSDEMIRTTDIPVRPFQTLATNKYPLDKGVPSLRIQLENAKYIIPRGDEYSRRMTDIWIGECTQFGFIDGKLQGIGAHDDTVMAWWIAEEAMKMGGFSFGIGDEDEEAEDDFMGGNGDWEKDMLGDPDDPLIAKYDQF